MDSSRWLLRGPLVPLVLALVAAAVVYVTATREDSASAGAGAADVPNELWRCQACAHAPGKSWIPCRTVTGRGNEKGARDRVKEVVCEEAGVSVDACRLTKIDCQQFHGDAGPQAGDTPSE